MTKKPPAKCTIETCDRESTHIRPSGCDCEPFPRLCAQHRRQHESEHDKLAKWVG
jgi:hypothetical protein